MESITDIIYMFFLFEFILGFLGGLVLLMINNFDCITPIIIYELTKNIFSFKNVFGIVMTGIFYIVVFIPCAILAMLYSLILFFTKKIYELGLKNK